jgi:Ca2+-binding RTX toxin-like protein
MNIETMEGRTLFSVAVSEASPGFYQFDGDSAADEITISVDMDNATLTYDGTEYTNVAHITVNAGGGNDSVTLTATAPGGIRATIDGGDGSDVIVCNFDASVWGGAGNDEIHLGDAFNAEAYGEAGSDSIYVSGYSFNAVIDGGAGSDYIDASENLYGATIYGGSGDDVIYGSAYRDTIRGDEGADMIVALDGDDGIYTSGDGPIDWIDGGDGNDTVYSDANEVSILNVETFA